MCSSLYIMHATHPRGFAAVITCRSIYSNRTFSFSVQVYTYSNKTVQLFIICATILTKLMKPVILTRKLLRIYSITGKMDQSCQFPALLK